MGSRFCCRTNGSSARRESLAGSHVCGDGVDGADSLRVALDGQVVKWIVAVVMVVGLVMACRAFVRLMRDWP